MPCLNEADTLEICLRKAKIGLKRAGVEGEIIVADNGSTDGSIEIALNCGVLVERVRERGYGHALRSGIAAARSRWVIMGDADDSYDFSDIQQFVEKLREGADLVMGCRLPSGGGTILPGAMPWSHRWLGNPMFSIMARTMFQCPINDVYCGLRAFTKEHVEGLDLQCTGMEFATEMIIKSSLRGSRIVQCPIVLHRDGRKAHAPHLKTIRDGWRTLRFFLIFSPRWLFFIPGSAIGLLGLVGYCIAMPGLRICGISFDAHTLLFSSLAIMLGYQAMLFALLAQTFAVNEKLLPETPGYRKFFEIFSLERGLLLGASSLLLGLVLLADAVLRWWRTGFGTLDYASTMRWVIPGSTLAALGFQTILSGFFVSILGLKRRV